MKHSKHKAKPEAAITTSLDGIIGYNLKRAYMIFTEDFKATEALSSISPRQFAVLSLVVELPNINQSEVARHLGIERSGMVKMIDDLEQAQLLNRVPVKNDRRTYCLVPTQHGQNLFQQYKKAILEHENKLLADFNEVEKQTLLEMLKRIQIK